jgi:hypothetical protein
MKKNFKILGLLAFALMSITACTEDNTVEPSAPIVGFWGVTKTKVEFSIDGLKVQADSTTYPADSLTINFTANGLAIGIEKDSTGAYVNDTSYYTLTGTNLQIIDKSTVPYDTLLYTATITGNKFKMKGTQIDTSEFGILKVDLELNATKLVR